MIRLAAKEDLPDICAIRRQVHEVHTKGRPDIFRMPENPAEFDRYLYEDFSSGNFLLYVYEADQTIMGYTLIKLLRVKEQCMKQDNFRYYIEEFGVDEACRNRGIGTSLMDTVIEQAKAAGADSVDLSVWAFNETAESFYRRFGMNTKYTFFELPLN